MFCYDDVLQRLVHFDCYWYVVNDDYPLDVYTTRMYTQLASLLGVCREVRCDVVKHRLMIGMLRAVLVFLTVRHARAA